MWLGSPFALLPALVLGDPCSGPGCDVLWFEGVLSCPPQHLDKQWAVQTEGPVSLEGGTVIG